MTEFAKTITDAELQTLIDNKESFIIDIWASWCAPCKLLGPTYESFAESRTDLKVLKLDVDTSSLVAQFGVWSVPTLLVFKDGAVVKTTTGNKTLNELNELVDIL